jgi:hypothetical protein
MMNNSYVGKPRVTVPSNVNDAFVKEAIEYCNNGIEEQYKHFLTRNGLVDKAAPIVKSNPIRIQTANGSTKPRIYGGVATAAITIIVIMTMQYIF